jgi:hypothetical protein
MHALFASSDSCPQRRGATALTRDTPSGRTLELVREPPRDDELELELADLGDESLRVAGIDPEMGEHIEGLVHRANLAPAMIERDEQQPWCRSRTP